jgi:hypothetical protein
MEHCAIAMDYLNPIVLTCVEPILGTLVVERCIECSDHDVFEVSTKHNESCYIK